MIEWHFTVLTMVIWTWALDIAKSSIRATSCMSRHQETNLGTNLGVYWRGKSEVQMKKYGKFAVLVVVIVGTLIWLATAGMKDTQTYYKTIAELNHMGDQAYVKRLRVGGDDGFVIGLRVFHTGCGQPN